MNYVNGFAIGDDGRVLIEDSKPVYYFDAMPMTSAGNSSGEQGGAVTFSNARAGFDADGKTVYQDVAVTPYVGKIFASMGFLHTDAGALLCDSVGTTFNFNGGVPMTGSGSVCIKSSAPPPPKPVIPSAPTLTSAVAKTDKTIDVALTAPTTGTTPFTYYAKAVASPAEPIVVKLTGITGTITGLLPNTEYTVKVYATNTVGQGGGGTKDSQPGGGGQSYAAIRWKK